MEIKVNKNQTRTAIYVRISTAQQKTDRQVVELKEYAKSHAITIDEDDIFIDVISGFKNGEIRPQYSVLKQKVEAGLYDQILFSEFSRLDRKPSNLLKSIEYYQSKGVHLYFKKQNIWIRDKSDISTQIMVSVLAVMSQYEIELFVARGIDGKITAIKSRGTNCGGFTAYGYKVTPVDHKLVIDEEEARVVQREKKRKAKGMEAKHYARIGACEELRWRPSSINRLIKNPLYIGRREFTFFDPEPSNPLPTHKRQGRKLFQQFVTQSEDLRIIDDALFRVMIFIMMAAMSKMSRSKISCSGQRTQDMLDHTPSTSTRDCNSSSPTFADHSSECKEPLHLL